MLAYARRAVRDQDGDGWDYVANDNLPGCAPHLITKFQNGKVAKYVFAQVKALPAFWCFLSGIAINRHGNTCYLVKLDITQPGGGLKRLIAEYADVPYDSRKWRYVQNAHEVVISNPMVVDAM